MEVYLDGVEDANGNCAVDPGETNPSDADSDDDGLADGSDPDAIGDVIAELPNTVCISNASGNRTAMLSILNEVEEAIRNGNTAEAIRKLQNLRRAVNGCGATPDTNDLIVDCAAQRKVRDLIDFLITNLSS